MSASVWHAGHPWFLVWDAATGEVLSGHPAEDKTGLTFAALPTADGKGLALSIVGGVPTGIGALVLTQQFGVLPISQGWLAVWAVGPGVLGGLVYHAVWK